MIVGVAVLSQSVLALIWAFASVFVLYWIARSEEGDLERIFGERYPLCKRLSQCFCLDAGILELGHHSAKHGAG